MKVDFATGYVERNSDYRKRQREGEREREGEKIEQQTAGACKTITTNWLTGYNNSKLKWELADVVAVAVIKQSKDSQFKGH